MKKGNRTMPGWFYYAVGAAVLYGLHQVFAKLAADRISDGLGGFVVECFPSLTIIVYLAYLRFSAVAIRPRRRVRLQIRNRRHTACDGSRPARLAERQK